MKKLLLLPLLFLFNNAAFAQAAADYAVQLQAVTQSSPPQVKLNWKPLAGTTGYQVLRKGKAAATWTSLATLTATDSTYTDNNVTTDTTYEYQVVKNGGTQPCTGFLFAGITAPATHYRGAMLLLVDSLFADSCALHIATLMNDLRGDGWQVIKRQVSRNDAVTAVKAVVVAAYAAHPDMAALLLLGHVPVPYSGNLAPDGHADHEGAWPADAFYADVNGSWTDATVNNTVASRPQNDNIPGDGKYDQTTLPSAVELQMGRIDFADMPAFGKSEITMMKSYLDRAHLYKTDALPVVRRALVDDNFGAFGGEAFAANAWRNFPSLVGRDSIRSLDLIPSLSAASYQWAYGTGGGSYTSAGGIGTSANFAANNVNGIFTMLFGSYFGDWDAQNCFLRAPLCANTPALTACWAGRPNWWMHHLALDETIGYATRLTQNNSFLYTPGNHGNQYVHVALMGDPSLRSRYVKPVPSLSINAQPQMGAVITWSSSADPLVTGYHVYRSDAAFGKYNRISSNLITGNSFTDTTGINGQKFYMIRPVKPESTPTGSYVNLGLGLVDSAIVSYPWATGVAALSAGKMQFSIYPNPAKEQLQVQLQCENSAGAVLSVTDASGRVLLAQAVHLAKGSNRYTLQVGSFAAGQYFVSVNMPDGTVSRNWVKAQ